MSEINSYRLIAYDVESGEVVFDWPNYADTHRPSAGIPALGVEGEVLVDDKDIKWKVIGTRKDSTTQVRRIDVRKVD